MRMRMPGNATENLIFRRFDRIQFAGAAGQKKQASKEGHYGNAYCWQKWEGSIQVGLAGLGSAIGVGLVGMKASEAVGRNPGAFGKI